MSEMEKLVAEKNAIDQEIGMMHQQIMIINDQITVYGMLIADKQEELDEARARLAELRRQNKERIRAMEEEGSLSYWSVLFKASSFADLLDRLNMIKEIAEADQRRLEEMDRAAKEVEEAQVALEGEKVLLEDTKVELQAIQDELALKRLEADEVLTKLVAKGEEFQKLLDAAEESEDALLQEIAQTETQYNKEYDRLKEEERKRKEEEERKRREEEEKRRQEALQNGQTDGNTSSTNAAPSSAYWMVPCSYVYLSSPFGYRIHPIHGTYTFHSGVDLASPSGTPIKATRGGTITKTAYDSASGYYVTINHGDGFSSSYLHMTHWDPSIYVGMKVSQGQVIGYVGSTGWSTGNHLHFSIYYNGTAQNPAAYMNF
jgi:murein DD-endopeptidase MepM/ murein hydrolase activator NlpD